METLDALVTYAYDLTLGGGFFYIGTSLTLYLIRRWNELEVKPRSQAAVAQTVNIPLQLPVQVKEALPLEPETLTLQREALPLEPEKPVLQRDPLPLEPLPQQLEPLSLASVVEDPEDEPDSLEE